MEEKMTTIAVSKARENIYALLDEVNSSHKPVIITGRRSNAVLISEEDWNAIQETLYLLSIPGMRESIVEGMNTPIDELSDKLDW
jgi:prevent-host-death family protein